ncbi:MAG: hypothetical protein M1831_004761 [Alyxoria varia]|nr:MAG: hypothetical protein M1831_004761 [Alyxoria varia]
MRLHIPYEYYTCVPAKKSTTIDPTDRIQESKTWTRADVQRAVNEALRRRKERRPLMFRSRTYPHHYHMRDEGVETWGFEIANDAKLIIYPIMPPGDWSGARGDEEHPGPDRVVYDMENEVFIGVITHRGHVNGFHPAIGLNTLPVNTIVASEKDDEVTEDQVRGTEENDKRKEEEG